MILLGVVLVIISLLAPGLAVLLTVGVILIVVGLVLVVLGVAGHPVGGRKYWF